MDYLNVIVMNGFVRGEDKPALFPNDEDVLEVSPLTDIWDLLLMLGAFPSRGQAKKNWKGPKQIPDGWSEFYVGKIRRHLCIWNPTF